MASNTRLTLALYRAFLREGRTLGGTRLRLTPQPTLDYIVRGYGEGQFLPYTPPSTLQAILFPGVPFPNEGLSNANSLDGEEVRNLVRYAFRKAPPPGDPLSAALRHLSSLNRLRVTASCNSHTVTTLSPGTRVACEVSTLFLPNLSLDSSATSERFSFAYLIRIHNQGSTPVQLLGRHWVFEDERGGCMEVPRGSPGVVGHSPRLEPDQLFEYISGVSLPTPGGKMRGSFQMLASDKLRFDAQVDSTDLKLFR